MQYGHTTYPENDPLLFGQEKDITKHKHKTRVSQGLISNGYNAILQVTWDFFYFYYVFYLEKCAL